MEKEEEHYLSVGTEVSAKYRGAFCEAKIKSVKKTVLFRITSKKDGKIYSVMEEDIKGPLKLGSTVEAQLPDASGPLEGVITSTKDKSTYTVEFDDGDVRTLSRTSLCKQGDRHFAESDTLDHLPLTDPENFGTPVLSSKRKAKRKSFQSSVSLDNEDMESDDEKISESEISSKRKSISNKNETRSESDDKSSDAEKRKKWLADPLMGKTVLVEPSDKRKHWFPAVCVNPMCIEDFDQVNEDRIVVRSFKNGKITMVPRCDRLTKNNLPAKVEPQWKEVLENTYSWEETGTIPDVWRADVRDIFDDDDKDDDDQKDSEEDEEKNLDFLEQLYKFMEDRGTPVNKTPVLGNKDLDLFLLYNLVQAKGGFHNITQSSDWKEIYCELGIPKVTQAAGHHAKMAYGRYLVNFEEYLMSFRKSTGKASKRNRENTSSSKSKKSNSVSKTARVDDESDVASRRTSRRRKMSESFNVTEELEVTPQSKRSRKVKSDEVKRDSDIDDASSTTSSEKSVTRNKTPSSTENKNSQKVSNRRRSNSGAAGRRKANLYKIGDKLKVKYGKDSFKLYTAKVVDVEVIDSTNEVQYFVHYAGWNSRHDEWIKPWRISSLVNDKNDSPNSPVASKTSSRRSKTPTPPIDAKNSDDILKFASPTISLLQEDFSCATQALDFNTPTGTSEAKGDAEKKVKDTDVKDAKSESKTIVKKPTKKRIRRRSTSFTSGAFVSPSDEKRSASVEKLIPDKVPTEVKEEVVADEEKSSGRTTPTQVPLGLFPQNRRTSGRRSKSPAYLKESALYGLTKRKRTNSNSIASEVPTTNVTDPVCDDDLSSETSSRSVGSSSSEANRASPLTVWTETDSFIEKNMKPDRKRGGKKSDDNRKSTKAAEEKSNNDDVDLKNATYDNFDEDTPNIELEKKTTKLSEVVKETNLSTNMIEDHLAPLKEQDIDKSNQDPVDAEEQAKDSPKDDSKDSSEEKKSSDSSATEETSESPSSDASTSSNNPPSAPASSPAAPVRPPASLPEGATCSSKALLENTPPTTPEASDHSYDEQDVNSERVGSPSSSEVHSTSSKKEEKPAEQTVNDKTSLSRKRKHSDNQSSSNRKSAKTVQSNKSQHKNTGESESEEESSKSKPKNRKKPKKKSRPEIPRAPVPITPEELAGMDPDQRIQVLQSKLAEMRQVYQQLKQEVSSIDRKRKRAKRREQEAAETSAKKSAPSSPHKHASSVSEAHQDNAQSTNINCSSTHT